MMAQPQSYTKEILKPRKSQAEQNMSVTPHLILEDRDGDQTMAWKVCSQLAWHNTVLSPAQST